MIALAKILILAVISICCSLTELNLDKKENSVKKVNFSNQIESNQIKEGPKNLDYGTV
jgi:hypothetical protein